MIRRFVNVVAESRKCGTHSLHRLDVAKHLLYPSTAEAKAAAAVRSTMIERRDQLPEKVVGFLPPRSEVFGLELFALVSPRSSSSEGRVLCADSCGRALLFHPEARVCQTMPSLRDRKGLWPISFSIGRRGAAEEDLYVMRACPVQQDAGSRCFEVLKFGAYDESEVLRKSLVPGSWHWVSLPPPPFVADKPGFVSAHTVVGTSFCISLSAPGVGTYCFDTVKREWHRAGEWVLPWEGGAEHVPEHNICLGFSQGSNNLCALDLSGVVGGQAGPPKLLAEWQDHFVVPEQWCCEDDVPTLINLGSARFCVAKIFKVLDKPRPPRGQDADTDDDLYEFEESASHKHLVLTGLELDTTGGGGDSMPRIVPHKSISYNFDDDEAPIRWVL